MGENYGRTSDGELIGPYDTVAELQREMADSEREKGRRDGERILTVKDVPYPNGELAACYALENDGVAVCISVNRSMELSREGVPYVAGHFMPSSFAEFFEPDFQPLGSCDPAFRPDHPARKRCGL